MGCRPGVVTEGIGLSARVAAAVPRAMEAVRAVLRDQLATGTSVEVVPSGGG